MAQLTRRQFLEDSLLAAAVAAAFPAADALAAEKKKSKRNRRRRRRATCCKWRSSAPAAAEASISREFLANPNTEIAYIVDADEKIGQRRAEDIGKRQGKTPKFVRDLRKALDDKSVHVVSTATPNHWHALCRDLVDAGRQGRLRGKAGEP